MHGPSEGIPNFLNTVPGQPKMSAAQSKQGLPFLQKVPMRTHNDILRDRHAIDERRREALRKANEELEPELRKLQAECAELGHHNRGTQFNMLGNRSHKECGYCGASYDWKDLD